MRVEVQLPLRQYLDDGEDDIGDDENDDDAVDVAVVCGVVSVVPFSAQSVLFLGALFLFNLSFGTFPCFPTQRE